MPTVLYAALINWIVTTIFVESKLFQPVRDFIVNEAWYVRMPGGAWRKCGGRHGPVEFAEQPVSPVGDIVMRGPWLKLAQLVTCQLCTRTWVGFALAADLGGPVHGLLPIIANGLLYAAGGHLIFELRSRVALVTPQPTADQE